jgi:predicted peroxiredoxin
LQTLLEQYSSAGGEMLVCPICFNARKLDQESLIDGATIGGATPLWEWIGDGATVFSY